MVWQNDFRLTAWLSEKSWNLFTLCKTDCFFWVSSKVHVTQSVAPHVRLHWGNCLIVIEFLHLKSQLMKQEGILAHVWMDFQIFADNQPEEHLCMLTSSKLLGTIIFARSLSSCSTSPRKDGCIVLRATVIQHTLYILQSQNWTWKYSVYIEHWKLMGCILQICI